MLGVGGILAACGDDEDSSGGEGEAKTKTVKEGGWPDLSGVTLTMVTYGGETGKAAQEAYGVPFMELTGAEVRQDGPIDTAKVQAQVESGNVTWDVVYVDGFRALAPARTELYEPVDKSIVDTSGATDRYLLSDHTVPFYAYAQVLCTQNSVGPEPTTWEAFFDTDTYPGKRTAYNAAYAPNTGIWEAALLADGVPEDELFPLDLDRVFAKLDTIKSDFSTFDTYAQAIEQLTSGEVAMAIVPNGTAYQSTKAGADISTMFNQGVLGSDHLAVTKGGPNVEAAMWFLKFVLDPKAQAKMTELSAYDAVVDGAKPNLDEVASGFTSSSEEHLAQSVEADWEYYANNYEEMIARWVEWASG